MSLTGRFAKPFEILMVEDNPGDVRLAKEALRAGTVATNVVVAEDGERALAILRAQPPYRDAVRPDLVILDLNLPRKDGREVLAEMKTDPALRSIPVVVLSSSKAPDDVDRAYQLGVNSYINKPMKLDNYMNVVKWIASYWLTVSRLPVRGGAAGADGPNGRG